MRPGNIDVRSSAVAGKQVAGLKQQIRYAAVQVHGGSDGNVFAHDLAHAGGDHALAVLQVHHARGAMNSEQHGIERFLVMGLLKQRAELIEPCVEKLVSHRAAGKSARIGKGHPLDAFDALDGAKALEARGIDRGGVTRDPRMAVEQLLATTNAESGLVRAVRCELRALDMKAADSNAIGFRHDNHAPKDRGYQTVPLWRIPQQASQTFAHSQQIRPPAAATRSRRGDNRLRAPLEAMRNLPNLGDHPRRSCQTEPLAHNIE